MSKEYVTSQHPALALTNKCPVKIIPSRQETAVFPAAHCQARRDSHLEICPPPSVDALSQGTATVHDYHVNVRSMLIEDSVLCVVARGQLVGTTLLLSPSAREGSRMRSEPYPSWDYFSRNVRPPEWVEPFVANVHAAVEVSPPSHVRPDLAALEFFSSWLLVSVS